MSDYNLENSDVNKAFFKTKTNTFPAASNVSTY